MVEVMLLSFDIQRNLTNENIDILLESIESYSKNINFEIKQYDKDFFRFIAKNIIFLKELYQSYDIYSLEVIISDYFEIILAIIEKKNRYIFLNERSIIENYIRFINYYDNYELRITKQSFEQLKSNYRNIVNDELYNIIRSMYSECCGYIHGSSLLKKQLSYYFDDCVNNRKELKHRDKYYKQIVKLISIFNRIIIFKYCNVVSNVFHRRKSVLEYLLGKEYVDFMFDIIEN